MKIDGNMKFKESNLNLSKKLREQIVFQEAIIEVPKETKKQKRRVFLVTFALLILFFIIACLLMFFGKNSKTLFLYAINQEYADFISAAPTYFNKNLQEEASSSSLTTTGSLKLEVDSVDENLGNLEKYSFDYKIANDYKNKNLFYQLQTYYEEKSLVDVRTYGTKKNLYLELKDLFSKYISIDIEEYDQLFENTSVKKEDADYVLQSIKNLVLESLQEENFEKSREKITYNDKEVYASKITYVLNEERFKESYVYVLNGILSDEKFLEIIDKYCDSEQIVIIEVLKQEKESVQNKVYLDNKEYNFSIYFEGLFNTPIKYEIISDHQQIDYFIHEDGKVIKFYDNGEEKANIKINASEISYSLNNDRLNITGSLKVTEQSLDFTIQGMVDDENFSGQVSLANDDKYNGKIECSLKVDDEEIKVYGNYEHKIGETVTLPEDLEENSIFYENLNEDHYNEIMDNIMKNETWNKVLGSLEKSEETIGGEV